MILLPNGCKCSDLKVNPSNWDTLKASLKKDWFIYYRYYPQDRSRYPKGKLCIIKGMNVTKELAERQKLVRELIEFEIHQIKILGFNPISEQHERPLDTQTIIHSETPFLKALQLAFDRGDFQGQTKLDIRSVLKYTEKAIVLLQFQYIPIKEIRPSHMLLLLEQCGKIKKNWSANNYNVYLKYLSILFSQLVQYRSIEFNPIRDIKKKKTIKSLRRVLTPEEGQKIENFIKEYDERFWWFINIFFHSGSRTTEILKVQGQHVDLKRQKVRYLVLKGRNPQWVERTIKDCALTFWQKALSVCGPNDYVFSIGLKPGKGLIRSEQIARRWKRHIKGKLGIDCDFYSLKHLNTDQTAATLGLRAAASHNSHLSTNTTLHYAVNEKERLHEKIKSISNHFGVKTNRSVKKKRKSSK